MENVVLVDDTGIPIGYTEKSSVHHQNTPLHLAFSCYIFGPHGHFLCTRRAIDKKTWPGVWTNSCCGHPQPGETLAEAMLRRVSDELGLVPARWGMVLPDFRYRAVMDNGVVENEICPVFLAFVDDEPVPNPAEVGEYAWIDWAGFRSLVSSEALRISPWCRMQLEELAAMPANPRLWPFTPPDELPERWRGPLHAPEAVSS
ncbi:isopentenyl-diphosphate Delta-isomerase [Nocardia sp. CDC159]|uniref:Isopentenyl-diphosphate Delta-isomerase n=1 Tax=Nocardia pulmonis TaxID=2951408 RepID=A0A9X2J006_9NOCA|nr:MULTISPECIES: isopentenyl-diphosphate Delta-isomerase [Nocardia]MCM6778687.1 isopentenyl-diphosphate Delta-isomerase [Nocardia pulmonis]MCM6791576.1 isopentenyl-diphosphate Delta-isomerase [Nocardia sp. CDC159]